MDFSFDEKVDMLFIYAQCKRNSFKAVEKYYELYPEREQPQRRYFQTIERKLRKDGGFQKNKCRPNNVTKEGGHVEVDILGIYFK